MNDDELREQARRATIAARGAQEQVEDEWSVYQSLVRMRMEVGLRVQQALGKGDKDVEAHKAYAALLPRIEAQRRVLYQAMVDFEKSEVELRAAFDAAFGSQAEE